tara:strand:+ start:187 stop:381 length:195 start_codon:yes stop_codon:yes gene_type:complete
MNRYKIKFERKEYYEMLVDANGGYEAAREAEQTPDKWTLVEEKTTNRCIGATLMNEGTRELPPL